jgi:hypothetical protein
MINAANSPLVAHVLVLALSMAGVSLQANVEARRLRVEVHRGNSGEFASCKARRQGLIGWTLTALNRFHPRAMGASVGAPALHGKNLDRLCA